MDTVVDLDHAAVEISVRRAGWVEAGLRVDPVTTSPVPGSLGVRVDAVTGAALTVVVHRAGWADIGFRADAAARRVALAPVVDSAREFGALLDSCVARVFGLATPVDGWRTPWRRQPGWSTPDPWGNS